MLTRLGAAALRWTEHAPWTNVYGLARTLLALGTMGTLVFSQPSALFAPVAGMPNAPYCDGLGQISLFCVAPDQPGVARYVAIALLAVVASGWRPRFTALPHWWVSFSVPASVSIPDGGDHVTQVLALLLLPVALTDRRRWHWAAPPEGTRRRETTLLAVAALVLIRVQVAGIYLHASVAKLGVTEWRDGTALYYWLVDPMFGAPLWIRDPLIGVLSHGTAVAALTWGSMALEFALVFGLFAPRHRWPLLLAGGVALHLGIAVLMGLWSFGLAMFAALVLYLRPVDLPFPMPERVRAAALAVAGRIRRATPSRISAVLPVRAVTRRP
ncbi:sporulation-delaying protein SdpB family protein [Plantactinospora endophytica]|uniref:HTTM-like domain-containing protein n=1 Tax=Plantactinospora endophytica TaxID=673535 RepID=A0ABQ4EBZ5_9ACTN|nr:sporulation-delaying protein SdpB family protein [Plantactinospora endophytica]GIG92219.1 hypothetical protein Pen02_71550 [Plantactinospora endophytica]